MKRQTLWTLLICLLVIGACEKRSAEPYAVDVAASPGLVIMGEDLQALKDDFNANAGKVRLVFLNGPTCGICLRGMADLNDAFVAASQNDDRLVTFVVHVPTMSAQAHHAADSMPLLDGPRVHHYWEDSGIIGQHYTEVMDVDMYVWDFWAIYGPDGEWQGVLPPVPDYYEHQLGYTTGSSGGFPKELMLDARRFAAKTRDYLQRVDRERFSVLPDVEKSDPERLADGTVIPHVGQPRNVAVRQHIIGRGGYSNLKRIQSIEARGRIEAHGESLALMVTTMRPNALRRVVGDGSGASVAERNADGSARIPAQHARILPGEFEALVLESFEFDGLFVEWPDKGHEVDMLGMQKFGPVLAWQLDLLQNGGRHWHLFVDSHTGDLVRKTLLNPDGTPAYIIDQRDFRETSGFRFPHRIAYKSGDGRELAVEIIDEYRIEVAPREGARDVASH